MGALTQGVAVPRSVTYVYSRMIQIALLKVSVSPSATHGTLQEHSNPSPSGTVEVTMQRRAGECCEGSFRLAYLRVVEGAMCLRLELEVPGRPNHCMDVMLVQAALSNHRTQHGRSSKIYELLDESGRTSKVRRRLERLPLARCIRGWTLLFPHCRAADLHRSSARSGPILNKRRRRVQPLTRVGWRRCSRNGGSSALPPSDWDCALVTVALGWTADVRSAVEQHTSGLTREAEARSWESADVRGQHGCSVPRFQ